ncbi:hypothetical protein HanRHA438_Chr17g0809101 [Helianthus annuus]|uniref:uncharacterized protein LOC110924130 n=1 Tax=Helianthus annuus TaxID=4232 RepID=UPI000B9086ED|nr:uncharacterized protein LOC110924130 [Helianthus annuus]KAJ0433096.1 hypothetical protein HanIR_Chr17g0866471 [Helianthus annuus]KAJ0825978.1 hypothetical protein HanRHA438_Chr17g0809101 [Helianthus annuus]
MQQQLKIEETGFAPSFSCYSSDSITSRAVAKAIHQEEVDRFDDFEFALVLSDEEGSLKETGSPCRTKCKNSNSFTASGSKRWIFRYLFGPKKVDSPKQKRNSGELSKGGLSTAHEQFYVQKRAENEVGKRRSYLPYRKDLVGLFANVKGMGKVLPF